MRIDILSKPRFDTLEASQVPTMPNVSEKKKKKRTMCQVCEVGAKCGPCSLKPIRVTPAALQYLVIDGFAKVDIFH